MKTIINKIGKILSILFLLMNLTTSAQINKPRYHHLNKIKVHSKTHSINKEKPATINSFYDSIPEKTSLSSRDSSIDDRIDIAFIPSRKSQLNENTITLKLAENKSNFIKSNSVRNRIKPEPTKINDNNKSKSQIADFPQKTYESAKTKGAVSKTSNPEKDRRHTNWTLVVGASFILLVMILLFPDFFLDLLIELISEILSGNICWALIG
jgi:hypothetical protein